MSNPDKITYGFGFANIAINEPTATDDLLEFMLNERHQDYKLMKPLIDGMQEIVMPRLCEGLIIIDQDNYQIDLQNNLNVLVSRGDEFNEQVAAIRQNQQALYQKKNLQRIMLSEIKDGFRGIVPQELINRPDDVRVTIFAPENGGRIRYSKDSGIGSFSIKLDDKQHDFPIEVIHYLQKQLHAHKMSLQYPKLPVHDIRLVECLLYTFVKRQGIEF